jgi:hypothetical protein
MLTTKSDDAQHNPTAAKSTQNLTPHHLHNNNLLRSTTTTPEVPPCGRQYRNLNPHREIMLRAAGHLPSSRVMYRGIMATGMGDSLFINQPTESTATRLCNKTHL